MLTNSHINIIRWVSTFKNRMSTLPWWNNQYRHLLQRLILLIEIIRFCFILKKIILWWSLIQFGFIKNEINWSRLFDCSTYKWLLVSWVLQDSRDYKLLIYLLNHHCSCFDSIWPFFHFQLHVFEDRSSSAGSPLLEVFIIITLLCLLMINLYL